MTTPIDPTIDYNKYIDFVDSTTSFPSKDAEEFVARIYDLKEKGVNIERLLTAAVGITAEGGEFTEIVKKIAFQGKELNDDTKTHLVKEMGEAYPQLAQSKKLIEDAIYQEEKKFFSTLQVLYKDPV